MFILNILDGNYLFNHFLIAYAISNAVANASASSLAYANITFPKCCDSGCCAQTYGKGKLCCDVANVVKNCTSPENDADCAEKCDECAQEALKSNSTFSLMNPTDTASVLSIVSIQKLYLLQCCCCTDPPATTLFSTNSSSSSASTFVTGSFTTKKKPTGKTSAK